MQNRPENNSQSGKSTTMVEDFQQYFDIDLVTTEEQKRKTYNIRYRVYCEEFKYEPAQDQDVEIETDEFDARSLHCLLTHKASGLSAGCVRSVCVDDNQLMPMEKYCAPAIDTEFMRSLGVPRNEICEISRLAVDGAFRRRSGEHMSRFGSLAAMDCSKREQRTFSLIAVTALLAGFAISELSGRPYCFAMMEPFLPRMLRRSGINVKSIGSEIDYHGTRAPYFSSTGNATEGMPEDLRDLYAAICAKFNAELQGRKAKLNSLRCDQGHSSSILSPHAVARVA